MSAGIKVAFVGAGRMAESLAKGFIDGGILKADQISCSDVYVPRLEYMADLLKCKTFTSNEECVSGADWVFLSVKPQQMKDTIASVSPKCWRGKGIVSIAAGVTLAQIESQLPSDCRVVRVMPNTPCLVQASASVMSLGTKCTQEDSALIKSMLDTVGMSFVLGESYMDAVTGVSGSGPAYVYMVIEGLSDGGVKMGLARDVSTKLAAQTVMGAAKMVLETGMHPGQLKDMVTSPAGTTIEAVHSLESNGVRNAFISAVEAAATKAKQMSKL